MGNNVFANNMEVSCKAADGKSICAFPDVCFTPPQTPATPPGVPIPYPNTGMASDTTDGSRTVKISKKEVMLKNKSYFKRSMGDEAGCAPKKGVVTSKNMGKVYFTAWSMDVQAEGENVVRHLDMTTHNHASQGPNTPPWAYMDAMSPSATKECKEESEKTAKCVEKHVKNNTHQQKRKDFAKPGVTKASAVTDDANVDWNKLLEADAGNNDFYNKKGAREDMCKDKDCKDQFKCSLVPFDFGCCDGKTPHHIVPAHCFLPSGERKSGAGDRYPGTDNYDDTKAPCICVKGGTKSEKDGSGKLKQHGRIHKIVDKMEDDYMQDAPNGKRTAGTWSFKQANDAGAHAVAKVTKCDDECLKKQSEAAHKKMGLEVGGNKSHALKLRADSTGNRTPAGFVPGGAVAAGTSAG
jgi:hypothetical protein